CAIAGWLAATSEKFALGAVAVVLVSLAFRRPILLVASFAASALLSEWFLAADRAGFVHAPPPASSVATWSLILGLSAAVSIGQRHALVGFACTVRHVRPDRKQGFWQFPGSPGRRSPSVGADRHFEEDKSCRQRWVYGHRDLRRAQSGAVSCSFAGGAHRHRRF